MTTRLLRTLAFALLATTLAAAQGTELWTQTKFDEFEKGTARGVAIRSDGTLELAPTFKPIVTTPSTYIWDMTSDPQGNLYVAAGSPARVYRITPAGQAAIIFQPNELQVQAIVTDGRGALYAATSPDGKVYKIEQKPAAPKSGKPIAETRGGGQTAPPQTPADQNSEAAKTPVDDSFTSSVYYDPKTKYIWALEIDPQARLYVATGDRGEIFRVNPNGQGSLFFKSDEAHIRSLAFDKTGNVIAGSDGSGLIYRISPAGEGFVLYSAPKKEITALAVDPAGNIYAAGVGEKRPSGGGTTPSIPPSFGAGSSLSLSPGSITIAPGAGSSAPPISIQSFSSTTSSGGSDVYLIAPDGEPRRIWSGKDDIVYTLGFHNGQLLAGTGNRGHVFALRSNGEYTDLLKASATQITAFAPAPNGGLYCSTSNLGKVFLLAAAPENEGSYDSDVFDAHIFSKWGRAEVRGRGNFDLLARSGNVDNPDRNWSTWQKVDWRQDAPINVPPGRFLQWRAVLHAGTPPTAVESVAVNYLSKNVAPVVDEIFVQPNARFNPPPIAAQQQQVQVGPVASATPRFDMPVPAVRDRDSIAVRWSTHDDNDDQLIYAIYYRGDNEFEWKLLKDRITDKFYSWDAGLLPDGGYTIKVVASDSPSHSPQEALTGSLESPRFEVDRTPPIVGDVVARVEGGAVHLTFRAIDGFSPIRRAEYSIDAGDWQYVDPVGQISDARTENYDVLLPMPRPEPQPPSSTPARGGDHVAVVTSSGEHTIVVRAYDRFDNMNSAKTVVPSK
jgi:hypothetical protein